MPVSPLIIRQFELFKALPDSIIAQLGQFATLAEVPRRKIVMQKGEVAHSLGLLLEGRLQGVDMTLDGHEAGLYFIEPNDFFGELSVVDKQPASEFVIALSPARFVMVPAQLVQQLIPSSPEIAVIINSRLALRLREAIAQRSLLAMPTPLQRICAQLTRLIRKSDTGEMVIAHAPTHQELAIMINVTRETVTRAFQKLQKQGVVKRHDNYLVITNLAHIQRLAAGIEQDKLKE
jgi:CRP/FNR family cyclic AMP-dependent transcriptional regulator